MSANYYDEQEWEANHNTKYERGVKTCRRCDREMEMSSDHGTCDSCASAMERGWEY